MPEVTRRTLLSFTAAASVVEPRLVKGKLPDANCRRKRRFGWFENAAGCRGSGLRKAPTEGARKGAGKFDDERDFSAKTTC
ncbi:hypothetical protein [Mesorhizobium sp.]|uniref:hypothetical protein n=1 Tax=Mesorhizobium sp. TaxID=1871066 RepID=UPI00257964DA|nr:hypothetical protein [Mesorhizobium sp.]